MLHGERGILASLLLVLLALTTSSLARTFEGNGGSGAPAWEWYIGLYLPFALFTLVSTYHFLDWAKKHRRQAVMLFLVLFGGAILFGVGVSNGPRPELSSMSSVHFNFTEQLRNASNPAYSFPQMQQGLLKMQEALSSTPYYSLTANAITVLATLGALLYWLVRTRSHHATIQTEKMLTLEVVRQPANTPREVIIRYYSMVCQMLRDRGMQIADSDTATDIYVKANERRPGIATNLKNLTSLFQEAKFSLHPITQQEASQASTEWNQISRELAEVRSE